MQEAAQRVNHASCLGSQDKHPLGPNRNTGLQATVNSKPVPMNGNTDGTDKECSREDCATCDITVDPPTNTSDSRRGSTFIASLATAKGLA